MYLIKALELRGKEKLMKLMKLKTACTLIEINVLSKVISGAFGCRRVNPGNRVSFPFSRPN
jgi:hypothetical protein